VTKSELGRVVITIVVVDRGVVRWVLACFVEVCAAERVYVWRPLILLGRLLMSLLTFVCAYSFILSCLSALGSTGHRFVDQRRISRSRNSPSKLE
jgi:hypothetical protein